MFCICNIQHCHNQFRPLSLLSCYIKIYNATAYYYCNSINLICLTSLCGTLFSLKALSLKGCDQASLPAWPCNHLHDQGLKNNLIGCAQTYGGPQVQCKKKIANSIKRFLMQLNIWRCKKNNRYKIRYS